MLPVWLRKRYRERESDGKKEKRHGMLDGEKMKKEKEIEGKQMIFYNDKEQMERNKEKVWQRER